MPEQYREAFEQERAALQARVEEVGRRCAPVIAGGCWSWGRRSAARSNAATTGCSAICTAPASPTSTRR
ncbi:hypothetical protein ACFQY4_30275 [Catellatospora bangladeshensis]|uniref:hypothetical protein n=1 Tax=Catellatospora bangladeshensis TaxID=310355 RepID=UPI00361FCDF5